MPLATKAPTPLADAFMRALEHVIEASGGSKFKPMLGMAELQQRARERRDPEGYKAEVRKYAQMAVEEGMRLLLMTQPHDEPVPTPEEWGDPFNEDRLIGKQDCGCNSVTLPSAQESAPRLLEKQEAVRPL